MTLPLSDTQHLAMRRNVEKLAFSALGAEGMQYLMPRLLDADAPPQVYFILYTLYLMPRLLDADTLPQVCTLYFIQTRRRSSAATSLLPPPAYGHQPTATSLPPPAYRHQPTAASLLPPAFRH